MCLNLLLKNINNLFYIRFDADCLLFDFRGTNRIAVVYARICCLRIFAVIYGTNNGDLKQVKYGNNDYVDYTYDDYGNISAISQNGTKNFTWQYDSTGNLYSHEDLVNNQRFVYTYDSTGRLVRRQVLDNSKKNIYSSQYGYDLNNNVSRFTSSAGGVSVTENFEYGKDNLASKYTYPSGKTTTYTYDGLMRRIKALTNTSVNIDHQYAYLASARGNTVKSTKIGWEHIGNYIYGYTYDANGNITKITRRDKTVANSTYEPQQQFAYDELNQLIRADDLAKNRTEVYTYDNGGNILSTTVYPLTWGSLSGVTATDTTTYTYGDSNWKDKLTAYGDTPITYDAIGNPLTYRGYTLTWQNGRQLASMKFRTINIGFTYDVDGLRTSKTIPNVGLEHKYYYVGDRLQYETLGGSSALWYFYDADGNPSGIRYKDNSGTVNDYYFVCNWRGDVIQIYNASGTLVGSYSYDAWGKVTENATSADTQNITETNPIRYRGYYYDTETRLYYLKSRYYDPAVKRFLNADDSDILQEEQNCLLQYNLYTYCFNNPANMNDDEGERSLTLKKKAASLGVTLGILLIALKLLGVVATPYIAIGVIAFAVGYLGYRVYKSAKGQKAKKKTAKKSGKEKASDAPDWAKREKYNPKKSADRNARDVLDKKYGKGNYKTGPNSEYSKIKKWLQRSKGYK